MYYESHPECLWVPTKPIGCNILAHTDAIHIPIPRICSWPSRMSDATAARGKHNAGTGRPRRNYYRDGRVGGFIGIAGADQFLNPDDPLLPVDDSLQRHWQDILDNEALYYVVARSEGTLISTCNLTIILNLTRAARPYGLIENVVTHPDYRKRGIGTQVLQYALNIAWKQGCYKVMLLTGSKNEATLRFYEQAGFVSGAKTGFVARPTTKPGGERFA